MQIRTEDGETLFVREDGSVVDSRVASEIELHYDSIVEFFHEAQGSFTLCGDTYEIECTPDFVELAPGAPLRIDLESGGVLEVPDDGSETVAAALDRLLEDIEEDFTLSGDGFTLSCEIV